jgi:hypothetical protein
MKICRKNSDEKGQPEERLVNAAAVFEVGYNEIILPLVVATIYLLFFLEIYIRSCSIHGTHIWSTTRFSVCMFNLITFIERARGNPLSPTRERVEQLSELNTMNRYQHP